MSASAPPSAALSSSITFDSKKIPGGDFELVHTEAAKHAMSTGGKKYSAIIVDFANYDRQGGDYLPNASKEGHRRITLNFSAAELGPGKFTLDAVLGASPRLSVGIHGKWDHVGIVKGTGYGEILRLDGSVVEGKVSVKDDQGTFIEATFSVPYTTAPSPP
jgi:hypothetical protein